MKRFLSLAVLTIAFGISTHAQIVNANDNNSQVKSEDGQSVIMNSDKEEQGRSGLDFSYHAVKNGFGLGFSMIFDYVVVNFSGIIGDTDKYITKNDAWRVGLGGNYRYWIANFLYAEGQAGVEYSHASLEYKIDKNNKEKESDGNVGLFVTPRIGLKLLKLWGINWGITVGYRWDFNKFKFDKEYTDDYLTIGISATM